MVFGGHHMIEMKFFRRGYPIKRGCSWFGLKCIEGSDIAAAFCRRKGFLPIAGAE